MPKLNIDGTDIDVPSGITLLQACELAGAEIPRFCYHERLSIAGNCRMCLVEWVGAPKPQASCALSVNDLRPDRDGNPPKIRTNSGVVRKARHGVMEFLLINHPLDCPICDQGGECDLQDQAMAYGIDKNRFNENKRAVENKYIGPLVKTIMTRCIHCTRCIRFSTEVAGVPDLGAIGRGEDMEITTYLERAMGSELQGNVIDLCPVGALTSRPYAFAARPWELDKTESIDLMDALGSHIRLDSRGREVMRILPRANDDINEEWISDKSRFHWDGLKTQRLDRPYLRVDGKLQPVGWPEAFRAIATAMAKADASRVGAIAGDLASCEEMFALKDLMTRLEVGNIDCRQDGARIDPAWGRASYIFNPGLAGVEQADALLMIGVSPRREAPVLNARIRKHWRASNLPIAVIGGLPSGPHTDLTYDFEYIGAGSDSLSELSSGNGTFFSILENAERPLIMLGQGALAGDGAEAVIAQVAQLADKVGALSEDWNGLAMLHNAAARVGGLDLGFVPAEGGKNTHEMLAAARSGALDILFLLGADEIELERSADTMIVYIGSHGDSGAHQADVILPGAAYSEKSGTYVNTEGRVQMSARAVFPPGEAREEWAILRALSTHLGQQLTYDSLNGLRGAMYERHPHLRGLNEVAAGQVGDIKNLGSRAANVKAGAFSSQVQDFYLTNPICRASQVMAECSALAASRATGTGTDG